MSSHNIFVFHVFGVNADILAHIILYATGDIIYSRSKCGIPHLNAIGLSGFFCWMNVVFVNLHTIQASALSNTDAVADARSIFSTGKHPAITVMPPCPRYFFTTFMAAWSIFMAGGITNT